jgi:ACS family sodium-dependent inorganic phosphate cotransporter
VLHGFWAQVNMSIAILPMSAEFQWSPTIVGLVQSSFFWGYLLTQIAGGIWADSIGGKQVLGFGVIWWSIATIATPIAAQIGLPALLFVRACMGVGEVSNPTMELSIICRVENLLTHASHIMFSQMLLILS